MTSAPVHDRCPHCDEALSRVTMPDNSGWQEEFHLACFNDECGYFVRGWDWMFEHYRVRASYRYRLDPKTGTASPLPVWSKTALRDRITEDDAIVGADGRRSTVHRSPVPPGGTDGVIPGDDPGTGGAT